MLPDEAWEWQPCNVLTTRQGKILFTDYQPQADGSVYLDKVTIVLDQRSANLTSKLPPTILRAPHGAVLKFEKPLSLTEDIGQLQRGQLNGEVQIFRPASSPQHDDSISLITQNVQISPERIFTLYETSFQFGKNTGRGKHLVIDLSPETSSHGAHRSSPFAGIERIEMATLYHLHLHRESSQTVTSIAQASPSRPVGAPRDAPSTNSNDKDLVSSLSGSLDLSCQGPFVFDFESKTASFEKQVLVQSSAPARDSLRCEKLIIQLGVLSQAKTEKKNEKLEVQKLIAYGSPVVIDTPTRHAYAEAEFIEYDLVNRFVQMSSQQSPVRLARDRHHFSAPEIRYLFSEDGRLGQLSAEGPGVLVQPPSDRQQGFRCEWKTKLTLQDDDGKKVASLDHAVVSVNDTQLSAEQLHLWFWELPTLDPNGKPAWSYAPAKLLAERRVTILAPNMEGSTAEAAAFWPHPDEEKTAGVQYADSIVVLRPARTPAQRTGGTYREEQETGTWRSGNNASHPLTATHDPVRTASQPLHWKSATPTSDQANNRVRDPRAFSDPSIRPPTQISGVQQKSKLLKFVGNQVQLQMLPYSTQKGPDGKSPVGSFKEMTVQGDVVVQQFDSKTDLTTASLEIRGQVLRAIAMEPKLYRLFVSGREDQPATVAAKELLLSGQDIRMDQIANRLWMDGAGEMQLVHSAKLKAQSVAFSTPDNSSPTPPDSTSTETGSTIVQWLGGMVFDGQQVYFETEVDSETRQQDAQGVITITRTHAAALSLVLNQHLNFRQSRDVLQEAAYQIETMVMVGKLPASEAAFPQTHRAPRSQEVRIDVHKYAANQNLSSTQQINVRRATIAVGSDTNPSKTIRCQGPGSLVLRQLHSPTKGKQPTSQFASLSQSSNRKANPIDLIQVKFDQSLRGDMDSRQLTIEGNVHTYYDAIDSWTIQPSEQRIHQPDSNAVVLDCQKLELAQWSPGGQMTTELNATGNARVNSNQFKAQGEQIKYDELSGQVVIESTGRGYAEIWYSPPGQTTQKGHMLAEKIRYNLLTRSLQVDNTRQIDLPNMGPIGQK